MGKREGSTLNWYEIVFQSIDMRSFSNLWYWIVLAVLWSSASHWVLGIPYHMITRAARQGGDAEVDLQDLARINAGRISNVFDEAGLWITGIATALLVGLVILGWVYWIEFAQAVALMAVPLGIIGLISVETARRILKGEGVGDALYRRLRIHRACTQFIGMISIFVTAVWGMFVNMSIGALL